MARIETAETTSTVDSNVNGPVVNVHPDGTRETVSETGNKSEEGKEKNTKVLSLGNVPVEFYNAIETECKKTGDSIAFFVKTTVAKAINYQGNIGETKQRHSAEMKAFLKGIETMAAKAHASGDATALLEALEKAGIKVTK